MSQTSSKTTPSADDQNRSSLQTEQSRMASNPTNPKLMSIMLELNAVEERERILVDRRRQIKQQKNELELYLRLIQASKKTKQSSTQRNSNRQRARDSSETETDSD